MNPAQTRIPGYPKGRLSVNLPLGGIALAPPNTLL
jgi:hypothetical protein